MTRAQKKFNAVKMMRTIRDRISAKIDGMTLEEELAWLASEEIQDPYLRRLQERVNQRAEGSSASPRACRR